MTIQVVNGPNLGRLGTRQPEIYGSLTHAGIARRCEELGRELGADVVVMGVGVGPATEFLRNSKGFEQVVDRTGAVQVDEFMKVKGLDNVYAIGVFYDQHSSCRSNNVLAVR